MSETSGTERVKRECWITILCPWCLKKASRKHFIRITQMQQSQGDMTAGSECRLMVFATLIHAGSSWTWQPSQSFRKDVSLSLSWAVLWHFHLSHNSKSPGQTCGKVTSPRFWCLFGYEEVNITRNTVPAQCTLTLIERQRQTEKYKPRQRQRGEEIQRETRTQQGIDGSGNQSAALRGSWPEGGWSGTVCARVFFMRFLATRMDGRGSGDKREEIGYGGSRIVGDEWHTTRGRKVTGEWANWLDLKWKMK